MHRLHSTVGGPGRRRLNRRDLRLLARVRSISSAATPTASFSAGVVLKDKEGEPVNCGMRSLAFAVDWNGDDAIDLIVGNLLGEA